MEDLKAFSSDCITNNSDMVISNVYYKCNPNAKTYNMSHIQSVDSKIGLDFSKENYCLKSRYTTYSKDFKPSMLKNLMNDKRYILSYKVDEYSKYIKIITYKNDRHSFLMSHVEYGKPPRVEKDLSYEDVLERLNYHCCLHAVDENKFFEKSSAGLDKWVIYKDDFGVEVTLICRHVLKEDKYGIYRECLNIYGAIENTIISLYTGQDSVISIINISPYTDKLARKLSDMLDAKIQIVKNY